MPNLESCLIDSMEEGMESYTSSAEYRESRKAIADAIAVFRSTLNEGQAKEFRRLMDMVSSADAEFSQKAYVAGFVGYAELRDSFVKNKN